MSGPERTSDASGGADRPTVDEDLVHGLLTALADEERASGATPLVSASVEEDPVRTRDEGRSAPSRRYPFAAILSAAAMITLVVLVALPMLGPRTANAAEIVRVARRELVARGPRTYEVRITRWGGPFSLRMVSGEVTYRPGTPPVAEGFLEVGESRRRIVFGRDAEGPWFRGPDGLRWARPFARELVQADEETPSGADLEAMTLDVVLAKLSSGYELEITGTKTMRVVIAKRRDRDRAGPSRVELELGKDGETIEVARIELDKARYATTVELRLQVDDDGEGR